MIRHNYFLKRLGSTLPLLFLIPLLTFWLMNLVPGNYFDQLRINPQISEETIQKYEELYHLDKPVLVQYFYWLRQLVQLDFGYSFAYKQPVLDVLGSRLGNTILLSGASFLWAWLLAIFLGLFDKKAWGIPTSSRIRPIFSFCFGGLSSWIPSLRMASTFHLSFNEPKGF